MKYNKTLKKFSHQLHFIKPTTTHGKLYFYTIFLIIIGIVVVCNWPMRPTSFQYYGQNEPRWANSPYPFTPSTEDQSDLPLGKSGCGPTSMAMVATTLSRPVFPPDIALRYGRQFHTSRGTDTSVFRVFAHDYNLRYTMFGEFTDANNRAKVQDMLSSNKGLVIVQADSGYFTRSGHLLVIRTYNKNSGEYLLADPNNPENNHWFTEAYLLKVGNLKNAFGFGRKAII